MNTAISLELLGMTRAELQKRVVEQIAGQMLVEEGMGYDEDGDPVDVTRETKLHKKLKELIQKHIDERIAAFGEAHVLPRVTEMLETLTLQKTNGWGEKVGKAQTFIEYLVERADYYMHEEVDFEGHVKDASRYSSWKPAGTRVAYMIDKYLHYTIETAMKEAVNNANKSIAGGLLDAIKINLAEVVNGLKVSVATKG